MIVLGIETSCDETAVALVEDGRRILASVVSSQMQKHAPFGGVVPEIAAREHLNLIYPLLEQALAEARVSYDGIDAVSVTQGPGLIGALLVGISFARGLATRLGVPLIPVDHVHAHIHGALLGFDPATVDQVFPCLALVVSGGHTNLYRMDSPVQFKLLAATIDDACGECFDKVAKILGLAYPGGPLIERLAEKGDASGYKMPHMVADDRLVFSYSGLKTHVLYQYRREKDQLTPERTHDLCAAFQEEALGQLVRKTTLALRQHQDCKNLLVAGGVAINKRLRVMMQQKLGVKCHFPAAFYCTDNAAMIAALGWYEMRAQRSTFRDQFGWEAYSRYPFDAYR